MSASGRLFVCARCRAPVIVCRRCDRGQIYCDSGCAQVSRRASLREVAQRYQRSRHGRFAHAERMRRYRSRQNKVTQHGSAVPAADARLAPTSTSSAASATVPIFSERTRNKNLRLASALDEAGFFNAEAMATIASIWRDVLLEDGMHWQEIRVLNQNALRKLGESGLLSAPSSGALEVTVDEWLFPLTLIDLRTEKVLKSRLRDIQADYWED